MKKKILIFFTISLFIISYYYKISKKSLYTIAIIQSASNKPLNILAESFINNISALLKKEHINIIYKNIEGSEANALLLAQQLSQNKDINLFFTIGVSPAQAIASVEKERPVIISGIADPYAYELNQLNMCGTIDAMDEITTLKMIINAFPDIKTIGILRTGGNLYEQECNEFRALCKKRNILVSDFTVNNESEILFRAEQACQNSQALLIPCDSLVVSALPYIIKTCKLYNIPIFTCFIEGVSLGCTGSTGTDYEKNGKKYAEIAKDIIINGTSPKKIGFTKSTFEVILYNEKNNIE
jgi:ABC-type uncharacterized transport system substrate-binding protein